jgi:HEXXH motif-containing protein
MSTLPRPSLRVFSHPLEGDFPSLANLLCNRFFRKTLRRVDAMATRLGAAGVPLDEAALGPDRAGFATYRPELGAVIQGLQSPLAPPDWPWLSAQTQLAAFLAELVPGLSLSFESRRPLVVAGHVLRAPRFTIEANARRLEVRDGTGATLLQLDRVDAPGVAPVFAADRTSVVRLGSAASAGLSSGEWMSEWQPETAAVSPLAPDQATSRQRVEAALELLERHAPEDYLWTTLLLHELVPLQAATGASATSQSFFTWPGEVQIAQTNVVETLALLLHECSHQYFYLALWNGPLIKRDAPEEYSAIKRRQRPMERVLLGYHALSIVLLALVRLRGSNLDAAELEKQIGEHRQIVAGLELALDKHHLQYLEPAGLDLFLSLRDRLRALAPADRPAITPSEAAAFVYGERAN